MADEIKAPEGADNGAEAKATQHTAEETQALIKQLREEAKQNRIKAQALEERLTVREREEQLREQELLKEQGKFKELYEKQTAEFARVQTEAQKAAAYQTAFQQSLDARIAAIPEGMRSLVPDGLEPLKLSEWLDKNSALLSNRRAPNLDAGAGGSGASPSGVKAVALSADQIQIAQAMGLTPERYAARLAEAQALRGK